MTAERTFSVGGLLGGLALSFLIGAFGAFVAGFAGMSTNSHPLAFLIGGIPGGIFVVVGAILPKTGFAQGLIIGGSIICLIGGACGAAMVGTSFH